jgi:hypothetical protein
VTEDDARVLLHAFDSVGGLEAWIADQPWQVAPGGWTVTRELQGWSFRLVQVPWGLRVIGSAPDRNSPVIWQVPRK